MSLLRVRAYDRALERYRGLVHGAAVLAGEVVDLAVSRTMVDGLTCMQRLLR